MAVLVFAAPFKGDPLFFFLASVIYVSCTTSIGLLVSLFARTKGAKIRILRDSLLGLGMLGSLVFGFGVWRFRRQFR
jgi:hypothetical protein